VDRTQAQQGGVKSQTSKVCPNRRRYVYTNAGRFCRETLFNNRNWYDRHHRSNKSAPSHTVRPGLLFSGKPGAPTAGFVWGAGEGTEGAYFGPDRKVYVYRNGVEIGRASVAGLETTRLSGTYV
jgi:hypothetical protein